MANEVKYIIKIFFIITLIFAYSFVMADNLLSTSDVITYILLFISQSIIGAVIVLLIISKLHKSGWFDQ